MDRRRPGPPGAAHSSDVQDELSGLFSSGVAVRSGPVVPHPTALRPLELQAAKAMGRARRAEFESGRALAREALAALGAPAADLPPDGDRVPAWPAGYCGSVSHARCADASLCAVAVAPLGECLSVGLDVECARMLEPRVARRVVTPFEWQQLAAEGFDAGDLAVTLFAAKEAVYKAQFPLTRRFLDFPEVRIHLNSPEGTFAATVIPAAGDEPAGAAVFAGRFCHTAEFVAAAVEIPAPASHVDRLPHF